MGWVGSSRSMRQQQHRSGMGCLLKAQAGALPCWQLIFSTKSRLSIISRLHSHSCPPQGHAAHNP